MVSIFPTKTRSVPKAHLETVTIRNFGGGLNAVDNDISMSSQFLKVLVNFRRTSSGSQKIRFGSLFKANVRYPKSYELREDSGYELREDGGFELREVVTVPADANILDMIYFAGRIIAVTDVGYIVSMTDANSVETIWSPTHAAALPGAPAFWSTDLDLVTFVPAKNTLIIHNGVDKPVVISSSFVTTYLQDLGTGSNTNVPIGKYGCIAANYHCVAGFDDSPTEVVISSKGTTGTFPLDPDPNDAISIDVGAYAPDGATRILGMAGFRTYLVVFMESISLQIILGEYDDTGAHTPRFPDTFPTFGLIGSRCITKVANDMTFAGIQGMAVSKKGVYTAEQMSSNYISSVIEPKYQKVVNSLTEEQKRLSCFTVYDQLSRSLLLFLPGGDVVVYTSDDKLNYRAWSMYSGMDYDCGCTTLLGRVFVAKGSKIYQLGNDTYGEKYYADKINDNDATWQYTTNYTAGFMAYDTLTDESYLCRVTHTSRSNGTFETDRTANPSFWELYEGEAIDFEFEMPWFIGRDAMKVKKTRFVSVGSKGTASFTLQAYVDNLFRDEDEDEIVYDPAATIDLVGNDAPGFGAALLDAEFGTGRRSTDPRLFKFPVKFKSVKFRVIGSTRKMLELINFSFLYVRGSYSRG